MPRTEILAALQVRNLGSDTDRLRVCQVVYNDDGSLFSIHFLGLDGEWRLKAEGTAYPDEAYLPFELWYYDTKLSTKQRRLTIDDRFEGGLP